VLINDTELNGLMFENIRPACEPKIAVTGTTKSATRKTFTFKSNDVSSITYRRGVDPIGRTLPFMELVWKEIYTGEVSKDGTVTKYEDAFPLMTVTLNLEQALDFEGSSFSNIFFPEMYLVGKPVVQGNELVWTARDIMYFLNNKQEVGFRGGLNFRNPMRYFILDERAEHKGNPRENSFITALSITQGNIEDDSEKAINVPVVYEGKTKNILKDIASTRNYFWDFDVKGMKLRHISELFDSTVTLHTFKGNTMKKYPVLTQNKNISAFSFKRHKAKIKTKEEYTITTPDEVEDVSGISVNRYELDGWGTVTASTAGSVIPNTINKVVYTSTDTKSITVAPVSIINDDLFVNNNKAGELYSENNTCFYKDGNSKTRPRMDFLNQYFNENIYTLQFECLPHFAIEPCDFVAVETNLSNGGKTTLKQGVVIEQELSYNGAWLQKITVHEVNSNGAA
jgi:hypothetical protein